MCERCGHAGHGSGECWASCPTCSGHVSKLATGEPLPPYLREAVDRFGADGVKEMLEGVIEGDRIAQELRGKKPIPGLDKNDVTNFLQYLAMTQGTFDFTMGAAIAAGCMLKATDPERRAAAEQYIREVFAGAVGRQVKKEKRSAK